MACGVRAVVAYRDRARLLRPTVHGRAHSPSIQITRPSLLLDPFLPPHPLGLVHRKRLPVFSGGDALFFFLDVRAFLPRAFFFVVFFFFPRRFSFAVVVVSSCFFFSFFSLHSPPSCSSLFFSSVRAGVSRFTHNRNSH